MNAMLSRGSWLLIALVLLFHASVTTAAPTAQFWEELAGSASGPGISASVRGVVPEHRNVSVAIAPDGRPVVAYTDWDAIVVKRWTGAEWELVGVPGSGHVPQIAFDSRGRMVVAWLQFNPITQSWEAYLVVREPNATDWEPLGESASGGGISGAEGPTNSNTMAMALGPDGTPFVAYDTMPTRGADLASVTSGIVSNRDQIYVKRWAGPAQGWVFVGSGREGGGASNARSFRYNVNPAAGTFDLALHGALSPTIAVGPDGRPIVAFVYTSSFEGSGPPAPYNGLNDDIYVTRWDGATWVPVGPAVPTGPDAAGLGGPGGVSNSDGWSSRPWLNLINSPVIKVGADNRPVVVWGETAADDQTRLYVRRWSGTVWTGFGGVGDGLVDTSPTASDASLVLGPGGPFIAWGRGAGAASSIFVRAWDGGSWSEIGTGSATGTGISGAAAHDFVPSIALDRAAVPTVAWINALGIEASGQTYVRTFDSRPQPDLTVTAITAPATARHGQAISVTSTVRNAGGAVSPAVPVRFYLTSGTEPSAGDVMLGSRTVGALAINGASTAATSLIVPATVEPGSYRVLAVVDPDGAVAERNESNNFRVSSTLAVTLFRPDLALTALKVPARAQSGRPLAITHTVHNAGPAPASASVVTFFIVSEVTADSVLLGTRALGTVNGGVTSTLTTSLPLPTSLNVPASYRVLAILDAAQQQTELDESNNALTSSPIAITAYRPDLTVTDLVLPTTAQAGRPLAIKHTVRNLGPAPAGASAVRFFLSADDTLDTGDVLLGSRRLAGLAAGASSTAITTLTLPGNTSVPATYRVIAVADALGQAIELDETNNTSVSSPLPITPYRPDLTISALTIPVTAQAGRPIALKHTVRNLGPAPTGTFTLRFFLSSDDALDAGDVLLGSRSLGSLAGGISSTAITTLTFPGNVSVPATYRVIAVAETLGQTVELDATNNVAVSSPLPITAYRPDLTISTVRVPATAQAGRPLAITHTVRNIGPAAAGAFVIRFYLSADDGLDSGDVLLGVRSIAGLAPGASSPTVTRVTVPATTVVPASYRIIAVADALGQQVELDESNNTMVSVPLALTAYRPDILISALSAPAAVLAGRPIVISHTVRNAGPAAAGPFVIRFFLSADGVWDDGDVLLGARALGGLAAGASSPAAVSVTVPATTATGTYRIVAVADAAGQQVELDETNDLALSAPLSVSR